LFTFQQVCITTFVNFGFDKYTSQVEEEKQEQEEEYDEENKEHEEEKVESEEEINKGY
jgi:hypothetical protein